MNYQQAHHFLDQLQFFKIKLGLDAVRSLLEKLGNPQQDYPTIHLAGTNGKGSVGAILSSLLGSNGYKVGFYSSPHLECVRERFAINGEWISEDDFAAITTTVKNTLGLQKTTYFECATAIAFLYFSIQKVDIAIIETGLGGRLDATNVITPAVSVITSIGLDHQQYLGDTLKSIASEKAGIIKENVPVVSGILDDAAQSVIQEKAFKQNCELYSLTNEFSIVTKDTDITYIGIDNQNYKHLPYPLPGKHQAVNSAIALAVLEILNKNSDIHVAFTGLADGLRQVSWPGRMELMQVHRDGNTFSYLLDGAHNEAGIHAFLQGLYDLHIDNFILVWGSMKDKTLGVEWQSLLKLAGGVIFTQAEPERSATPQQLLDLADHDVEDKILCSENVYHALKQAELSAQQNSIICVAGSLHLVGKARSLANNAHPIQ